MKYLILFIPLFMFSCNNKYPKLEVVRSIDLTKYAGTWYEIARLPNSFEKKLECVSASYTLLENGKIEVKNRGHLITDNTKVKDIKGTAWVPDVNVPAKLKVRFFWPFSGNYWVLALDENYQYALIGDPSRKFLWILARQKELEESIFKELSSIAQRQGFDTSQLIMVPQHCK